jgi:phosphatidylserine/phosphatidylglycerophosphate/cardiolipin synthase-like enzyme
MRLLPLLSLALVGCAAPSLDDYFVQMDVRRTVDQSQASAEFISTIERAEDTLWACLPQTDDPAVAQALVDAFDDGVDVEVVLDTDEVDDAGALLLREAGVPIRRASGSVDYFDFILNSEVGWTSDQVIMSHAFVVADDQYFTNATQVGGTDDSSQLVFQGIGEDLVDDLRLEHNQMFGGSDATALTAFFAPAKSRADNRKFYPTDSDAIYELWFGPQDRVTKRVIDAIYSARVSIRVMTNELANDGLANAIQEKASYGFPVEVIVGSGYGSTNVDLRNRVTRALEEADTFQFDGDLPTVILLDIEGKQGDLDVYPRAFVLSHDLYSAVRFFEDANGRSREIITDQFIDGNLNVLTDENYRLGEDSDSLLQPVVDLWMEHLESDRTGAF